MTDNAPETIGSSDAPKILGLSPWGGPWSVWPELVGLVPRYGGSSSPSSRRGHRMEALVLSWWAETEGARLQPGPGIGSGEPARKDGWAHCREDALALEPWELGGVEVGTKAVSVVEAKTLRWFDSRWGPAGSDQVRVDYLAQVYHQLFVLGMTKAVVVAYATGSDDLRAYHVNADPTLVAHQAEILRAWHKRHVIEGAPPPWDASAEARQHLHRAYGLPEGKASRQASPAELEIAAELADVKAKIKALTEIETDLTGRLCASMGSAYGIEGAGLKAIWFPVNRRTININALRDEAPDVAERFTRTTPGRTFRLYDRRKKQ